MTSPLLQNLTVAFFHFIQIDTFEQLNVIMGPLYEKGHWSVFVNMQNLGISKVHFFSIFCHTALLKPFKKYSKVQKVILFHSVDSEISRRSLFYISPFIWKKEVLKVSFLFLDNANITVTRHESMTR
jgi:hypothetical protein